MQDHPSVVPGTYKAKLRLFPILLFTLCSLVLAAVSYVKPQPYRAFYGGLAGLLIFALIYQYLKETSLTRNHLAAVAAVTDYRLRGKHTPYFGGGVPTMKYEFVIHKIPLEIIRCTGLCSTRSF